MQYAKPELNVLGAAEGLVLGGAPNGGDSENTHAGAAFEFEE